MPTSEEVLEAQAQLWCHAFGYLKSIALQSAIELRIPTAIHCRGGASSLSELHAALPVPSSKRPCLSHLMKLLSVRPGLPVNVAGVPPRRRRTHADIEHTRVM
ncbi:hypothetical protein BAE44_0008954 [Dichanthelium oligosanthes]|uniref:O-methyltransferase dimerisation domain-containing protein n=1 Tax=Dichanthelium oligosanthes TaxID=888268 RepID=A0A1E5VY31_9POAL|nr:hypothetical protein BAE44_0008954 [Dichanthelium oligosanthes]